MFIMAVDNTTGGHLYLDDSLMQYESNYLAALMNAHPDLLEKTMLEFKEEYLNQNGEHTSDIIQNIIEKMRFPWGGQTE